MKRYRPALAALAVMAALSLVALPSSNAASTVSNTTYVVNGREVPVGFDPISLKSGLLIPEVLMDQLGVTVNQSDSGAIAATRGPLSLTMQIGSKLARLNGSGKILENAPIRVSGQLYIPSDALSLLGTQISNEGGYLLLSTWPTVQGSADSAKYAEAHRLAAQERTIAPMRDNTVRVEVVKLNTDVVMGQAWTSDPSARGQVLDLLRGATLFQITITNTSDKVMAFAPSSYFLVDNLGNQYTLSNEQIPITGDLFGNLAPGAIVSGVLVYPGLPQDARVLNLYLQTQSGIETIGVYAW